MTRLELEEDHYDSPVWDHMATPCPLVDITCPYCEWPTCPYCEWPWAKGRRPGFLLLRALPVKSASPGPELSSHAREPPDLGQVIYLLHLLVCKTEPLKSIIVVSLQVMEAINAFQSA